ncbi:hypothetical protein [Halobacillus halophilus]
MGNATVTCPATDASKNVAFGSLIFMWSLAVQPPSSSIYC